MARRSDDDGIRRRDFLNGVLLAAGGAAVSGSFPLRVLAHSEIGRDSGDGGIGLDPRALRGGNVPSVFNVGHWLRDERLTFQTDRVRVAPAPYDNHQGWFDVVTDTGDYDVIVAGSGMAGLATAFYLQRQRPGTRVLLLDATRSSAETRAATTRRPSP